MTRWICVLLGAVCGVVLCFALTCFIGEQFGPFYTSEDDMRRNMLIFLAASIASAIAFGALGYGMSHKFLRR